MNSSSLNYPNILTLLRICLIPILVLFFYWPFPGHRMAAAFVFLMAALTDLLDGYLARRLGQESRLGSFLDPVADKLVVSIALILLLQTYPETWLALATAVIIGREIVVSALREWVATLGCGMVAVSWMGKLKTTAQMLAITLLLCDITPLGLPLWFIGLVLIYLAAVLTLLSLVGYLVDALRLLKRGQVDPAGNPGKSSRKT